MLPYRQIKSDVLNVVGKIPEITGITHINAHWMKRNENALSETLGYDYGTAIDIAIQW
jgi:hypothetical protein